MDINNTMTWRNASKSNYYEHILLIVVASIGLAGSLFVFSECPDAEVSSVHTGVLNQSVNTPEVSIAPFDQLVHIEGDFKEQQKLNIHWTARKPDARYVLDMGNGERVMLRGDQFDYIYNQGGTYTLSLKEIENDLITTISTSQIEIANDNAVTSADLK